LPAIEVRKILNEGQPRAHRPLEGSRPVPLPA
jgi:hypothetical protein